MVLQNVEFVFRGINDQMSKLMNAFRNQDLVKGKPVCVAINIDTINMNNSDSHKLVRYLILFKFRLAVKID